MKNKHVYIVLKVMEKEVRESARGKNERRKLAQTLQCYLGLFQSAESLKQLPFAEILAMC